MIDKCTLLSWLMKEIWTFTMKWNLAHCHLAVFNVSLGFRYIFLLKSLWILSSIQPQTSLDGAVWSLKEYLQTALRAVKSHCHLCMLSVNKKVHILFIANTLQKDARIGYQLKIVKLSVLCTTGANTTRTDPVYHFHGSWRPNRYF